MIKALDVGHPKIAELKVKRNPQYFYRDVFFSLVETEALNGRRFVDIALTTVLVFTHLE